MPFEKLSNSKNMTFLSTVFFNIEHNLKKAFCQSSRLVSKQSCAAVIQNISDFRSSLFRTDMKIRLAKLRGNLLPSYADFYTDW